METEVKQSRDLRPSFENPPVHEVVLGVQFEPIDKLRTPQIGALWQEFQDRFPNTEEHNPIDPVIERFGVKAETGARPSFQVLDALPTPRCWFLSEDRAELIQIQPDRFIRNWRKLQDGSGYPRYQHGTKSLREAFVEDYRRFVAFIENGGLGAIQPNQCEVTYINLIEDKHEDADEVVTLLSQRHSDGFLGKVEDARIAARYVIHGGDEKPIGRLHVVLEPVHRLKDREPMLRLTLTARGQPIGQGIDGILGFMDLGHDWVVRGFASVTTKRMHAVWRRQS